MTEPNFLTWVNVDMQTTQSMAVDTCLGKKSIRVARTKFFKLKTGGMNQSALLYVPMGY